MPQHNRAIVTRVPSSRTSSRRPLAGRGNPRRPVTRREAQARLAEYDDWYEFFITWGSLAPAEAHAKATDLAMCGLPEILTRGERATADVA